MLKVIMVIHILSVQKHLDITFNRNYANQKTQLFAVGNCIVEVNLVSYSHFVESLYQYDHLATGKE